MPDHSGPATLQVLLIDDHTLFRRGLRMLLRDLDASLDVSEASHLDEALGLVGSSFDLILLDMNMPGQNGPGMIPLIRETFASAAVVVVSGEDSPVVIRAAITAGAAGYIPKTSTPELMLGALRLVLAQGVYLPMELFAGTAAAMVRAPAFTASPAAGVPTAATSAAGVPTAATSAAGLPTAATSAAGVPAAATSAAGVPAAATPAAPANPLAPNAPFLTARQWEILRQALRGVPNKVVAERLGIAPGTVKSHLSTIYRALNVRNRVEAVYVVAKFGISP